MGAALAALGGCAAARQVQYFEVVDEDPDTGESQTNYFRMTVRGGSCTPWSPVSYKLKAAYLNAETVDVLEGKGAFVPEADLPREADETYRKVLEAFRGAVAARAAALTGDSSDDQALIETARQAWLASLSDGDIVSIGRTRSDDPHEFRKLVFYASAKNIDLQKTIGPSIDSIIGKVQTLARREQQRAGARRRQRQGLEQVARRVFADNPHALGFMDAFFAATSEPSGESPAPAVLSPAGSGSGGG